MKRNSFLTLSFLVCFLMGTTASAQPADSLSLARRVFILSKTYATIPQYFAHWQDVPRLNLDSLYQTFMERAIRTPDRFQFDLLMMEFIGHLNNGHSWYFDRWLFRTHNQPLGFTLRYLNGQWVVVTSALPSLEPGTVVKAINGIAMESFYQQKKKYISASNDRARRTKFSFQAFLFPTVFTIQTADGQEVTVNRLEQKITRPPRQTTGRWLKKGKVAYIKIPGFDNPAFEAKALELVREFHNAKTLIFDLRGNGGGSTPSKLVEALMDRPYRYWTESTPINLALFNAYAHLYRLFGAQLPPAEKAFMENMALMFTHPHVIWPAQWQQPDSTVFTGKLIFLIDRRCASACEDFIVPFKDNHRAVLVGETTMGSSGQPFIYPFDENISIAIGTKREYMPDGSPFEGKGIAPDVTIVPTIRDLRKGRDVVLRRAISLASK